jgi:prevent-host-death family protein
MSSGHAPRQVNIHETKTHLSKLLARVEAGEEIVIARAGKPIAKIVRLPSRPRRRKGGFWKGLGIVVADDFNDPLPPEILAEFEDGPIFP